MSAAPGYAFPISQELYNNTRAYIDQIGAAGNKSAYKPLLATIVEQSTSAGLNFFLVSPLEIVGVNRMLRSATQMAVNAAERGIFAVSRRVVGTLSDQQMVALADFLAGCLVAPPAPDATG